MSWFGRSRGIDWTEFLQSRRIAIISEADSGKTYECQSQQRRLFAEGKPAIFCELSELGMKTAGVHIVMPHFCDEVVAFNSVEDEEIAVQANYACVQFGDGIVSMTADDGTEIRASGPK